VLAKLPRLYNSTVHPARLLNKCRLRAGRTVLEGQGAGKEMFDKGELAAILRFGAENLFEEDRDDMHVKEAVQKRDQQLYEEDIEAILARAEVVDNRIQVRAPRYSAHSAARGPYASASASTKRLVKENERLNEYAANPRDVWQRQVIQMHIASWCCSILLLGAAAHVPHASAAPRCRRRSTRRRTTC
jgi:hypothetical protein